MDLFVKIVEALLVPILIMLPGFWCAYKAMSDMKQSPYGFCLSLLNDGKPSSQLDYVRKIKKALDEIEDEVELTLLRVEADRQQAFTADFTPIAQLFVYYGFIVGAGFSLLKFTNWSNIVQFNKNYSLFIWGSGLMMLVSFLVYGALIISNFTIKRADAVALKELIDIRIEELHVSSN